VKDAFVQYRMICQQAQSGSMERVMRYYQKLSEEKAAAAQVKAAAATAAIEAGKPAGDVTADSEAAEAVEDLEEESPEAIMLAAMSGEGTKVSRQHALCIAVLYTRMWVSDHPSFCAVWRVIRSVWIARF